MRWFLDTEFNEQGASRPVELISIALVAEDESVAEFYAVSAEIDERRIVSENPWVAEHVLSKLPSRKPEYSTSSLWMPRWKMAATIAAMMLPDPKIEVWGYFADYDWVAFCQIFGRMIDLPKGMPQLCLDVKQEMKRLGITREMLPKQSKSKEHSALEDARWTRDAWRFVNERSRG